MDDSKQNMLTHNPLKPEDRALLLRIARQAIEDVALQRPIQPLELEQLPDPLRREGATFITLTKHGELRGCIGAIEPQQSLAEDVRHQAVLAAFHDPRFPPLSLEELPQVTIEVSYLTPIEPLEYNVAEELISSLRPGIDGVLLRDGCRRATFLPQVWEKIPDPEEFLCLLCQKMGVPPDYWRTNKIDVGTYQVEEFHEQPKNRAI